MKVLKQAKKLSVKKGVCFGAIAVALACMCSGCDKVNNNPDTNISHKLNSYFSKSPMLDQLTKLNDYGVTKINCFTEKTDGRLTNNPLLVCYLGSNQFLNEAVNENVALKYRNPNGATPTFTESAWYYSTVSSDGSVTNDCQKLSDSKKILENSIKKSWMQVYMNGSILGEKLNGKQDAVFVVSSHHTGAMTSSNAIHLFSKVLDAAVHKGINKAVLGAKSGKCQLSVY